MKQAFSRISSRIIPLISMIFRAAREQAYHKKLTRYIVALSRQQSSREIVNEAALCLNDILNCRLSAFVIKKEKDVDIWLGPGMYDRKSAGNESLEDIILKDFPMGNKGNLTFLNPDSGPNEQKEDFNAKDLIYYELEEDNCSARLYLLPGRKNYGYHDEVVNLVLQGCFAALSRQVKIDNLTDAVVIDPLTGCYNRREFENQLKRNIAGAIRHKNDLSMFMLDLDYFKKINDTYGHLAGDKVLQKVAALLQKNMRTGDILARFGGEEFIAILPETNKIKAMELADRLRVKISNEMIQHNNDTLKITASFGVSQLNPQAEMTRIIQDADTMLYKAKLNGRNTVMPGLFKVITTKEPDTKMQYII